MKLYASKRKVTTVLGALAPEVVNLHLVEAQTAAREMLHLLDDRNFTDHRAGLEHSQQEPEGVTGGPERPPGSQEDMRKPLQVSAVKLTKSFPLPLRVRVQPFEELNDLIRWHRQHSPSPPDVAPWAGLAQSFSPVGYPRGPAPGECRELAMAI